MGERADGRETRASQDRLVVDPAGAARKNGCLSREICRSARGLATDPETERDGAAEVSRSHSTGRQVGKG